jgi:hypothetical protein
VEYSAAGSGSGGMLVSGITEATYWTEEDQLPVDVEVGDIKTESVQAQYLTDAVTVCANSYYNRSEENLVDGSFLRFRELRLGYTIPSKYLKRFPVVGANIALSVRNVAMLSSAEKGIDPTTASNGHGDGFSYWEGGVLPSTRVVSLNLKVNF